jgi:hypothetical protein
MQLWSQPVYGLNVSLLRQVHRGECHGSNGVSSISMFDSFVLDLSVEGLYVECRKNFSA